MSDPATISEVLHERALCYERLARLDRLLALYAERRQSDNRDALWGSELNAANMFADLGVRLDRLTEQLASVVEVLPHMAQTVDNLALERRAAGNRLDARIDALSADVAAQLLELRALILPP